MLEKIALIICDFVKAKPEDIKNDTNLRSELGLNSLDLINIAVEIEKKFGVAIEDKQLNTLKTVGDLIACVK